MGNWVTARHRNSSMLSPTQFIFLNQSSEINAPTDWNDAKFGKLWLYNLHYFDDLNAARASERLNWHRSLIERWLRENPPGWGLGWEAYPLSLRIVNWIKWALAGNELSSPAIVSLAVQARYLTRTVEWGLLGNHLIANAKALVFAGLFFQGAEANKWVERGLSILNSQLAEQILGDGGHFELSPMYHCVVLEDMLDLCNLLQTYPGELTRRQLSIAQNLIGVIGRMQKWLGVMCHPDGQIAFFNDAALDAAPMPIDLDNYAQALGLAGAPTPADGITHLPDSGYIRMQKGPAIVILDAGRIGPEYLPGHAHADTLSFELSLFASRLIVNSGTSLYENCAERHRQRSTSAHNTVVIDGENSSEVWGAFRVARRAHPFDLRLTDAGNAGLVITCSHDGYRRLAGSILHRRTWRLDTCSLMIEDRVEGKMKEAIGYFHFHPTAVIVKAADMQSESEMIQMANHSILWSSKGVKRSFVQGTYHPSFGLSQKNICAIADFQRREISNCFSWC
jgi:uncharacterized heparinase superfamily protein